MAGEGEIDDTPWFLRGQCPRRMNREGTEGVRAGGRGTKDGRSLANDFLSFTFSSILAYR